VKLKRLEIHNYKSLRNVVLEPAPLSVFVGPNAAGKSNFADALDFLSEVYRWDLEGAVKEKGGYENLCFRQSARSQAPIRFRLVLEQGQFGLDHTFELRAKSRGIGAPFFVSHEELTIRETKAADPFRIVRTADGKVEIDSQTSGLAGALKLSPSFLRGLSETQLTTSILNALDLLPPMDSLRVFQLNPRNCREEGSPTPNADLDRFGGNLPAVIDHLKTNEPGAFDQLLEAARQVMPSLQSIEAGFTHTKRLGLFVKEAGVKRPWTAGDVSDGTIQTIALLAATFDPRIPLLVIEEPENSVHPWAVRNFVEAFRSASEQKQIFLTTHSPILIDQVRPEELWVVQRPELETKITPVLELDPSLKDAWGQGKFTLSEYLDSGAVPAAVPAPGV
jgi:predicted ATPase